tara:strand:+ start:478 stop:816 length:339 start_codon:yes stop_codon:yes gene_type:complete
MWVNGCCCFNCSPINKKPEKPNALHKTEQIKSIKRTFNTARNHNRRTELRIHDLRHTLGNWLNRPVADTNKIKQAMGHSDIVSTQRYLHLSVDEVREELNKNIRFNISAPRE